MKYPAGKHPKSLENLKKSPHTGRTPKWGDRSKHEVRVSDIGWEGSQSAARAVGCSGISEMLELLARGEIVISRRETEG